MIIQSTLVCSASERGVIYYVKPSQTTKCPGQPCESLQYYFENVNTTINQQKNVTMVFLTGNHSLNNFLLPSIPTITVPFVRMIGEIDSKNVVIGDKYLTTYVVFYNNTDIYLERLTLLSWIIEGQSDILKPTSFYMLSVKLFRPVFQLLFSFINCQTYIEHSVLEGGMLDLSTYSMIKSTKLEDIALLTASTTRLEVEDSELINTPIDVGIQSSLILSGTTILAATNQASAISSYQGNITLSGNVSFINNSGIRGGAMTLYLSSTVNIAADANVAFINNSAEQKGGAIYIEPGIIPDMMINSYDYPSCFYQLLNCGTNTTYNFYFVNNSAIYGGDDIYGASLIENSCPTTNSCSLTIIRASPSNSSVSSDPLRVCICDSNGEPQCESCSYTLINSEIHPGEIFTLSLVLVGGDRGLTTGIIYADILPDRDHSTASSLELISPHGQFANNLQCNRVDYSLYAQSNSVLVFTAIPLNSFKRSTTLLYPENSQCDTSSCFIKTPVFIDFTILPCPPGFILLGDPPRCDCYPALIEKLNVTCYIIRRMGYFSWIGNLWLSIEGNGTIYNEYCPHNYCNKGSKEIDLLRNSTGQCDFNRAGRLCGECKENYSLAIGSSHCIHCPNSNNFALVIFFTATGFLLVFFIGALNLTVTQGMINGLIFYANIVWTYQDVFFTQEGSTNIVLIFLKTFIAWVNLDFGIETCFVEGLTSFWKTWLQFVFPFYIWAIAVLIIVVAKYSSRLTNLLGNRAVPLLATLFLLSYMKLLRTVVSTLEFSILSYSEHPNESSSLVVWSIDGSLTYFEFPHILLFMAGLITLLFLWMPYTLLLILVQWLRKLPQRSLLKWVMRLYPFYDACFVPLKHKYHYWFGILLLVRGILLVAFASTFAIPRNINLALLLVSGTLLVYLLVLTHPYKSRAILIVQISYLMNLTLLSGFVFFTYTQSYQLTLQSVAAGLSIGVAFFQFCGTVVFAVIGRRCCRKIKPLEEDDNNMRDDCRAGRRLQSASGNEYYSDGYRDSILDESAEPLLPTY